MDTVIQQQEPQQPVDLQPVQPPSPAPEHHLPFLKIVLILLGIVVVSSLIGGAYLLGAKQKSSPALVMKQEVKVSPTQIPTPTANPASNAATATANWKTYTSPRFNFSIKYPPTWITLNLTPNNSTIEKVGDSEMSDAVVPPDYHNDPSGILDGGVFFQIFKVDPAQSLSEWIQVHGYQLSAQAKSSYLPTTIDNHDAVQASFVQTQELFNMAKQTSPLPVGYKAHDVYVKNGDYIIGLEASGNIKNPDEDLQLFDQMLATFKFTQ